MQTFPSTQPSVSCLHPPTPRKPAGWVSLLGCSLLGQGQGRKDVVSGVASVLCLDPDGYIPSHVSNKVLTCTSRSFNNNFPILICLFTMVLLILSLSCLPREHLWASPPWKAEPHMARIPSLARREDLSTIFMPECPWQRVEILGHNCDLSKFCRRVALKLHSA